MQCYIEVIFIQCVILCVTLSGNIFKIFKLDVFWIILLPVSVACPEAVIRRVGEEINFKR